MIALRGLQLAGVALLLGCAGAQPRPHVSAGVGLNLTAGGPYVSPYVGVGIGVSARRLPDATFAQASADKPLQLKTSNGIEVRLDRAEVAVAGGRLSMCNEGDLHDAVRALAETTKPEPVWLDLLSPQGKQIGKATLEPGRYCVVAVRIAPAGGTSLRMQGAYRKEGEAAWTDFALTSDKTVTSAMELKKELRVEDKEVFAHVRFEPELWFDGVAPGSTPDEIATTVLANLARRPGEALTPQDGEQASVP